MLPRHVTPLEVPRGKPSGQDENQIECQPTQSWCIGKMVYWSEASSLSCRLFRSWYPLGPR